MCPYLPSPLRKGQKRGREGRRKREWQVKMRDESEMREIRNGRRKWERREGAQRMT